MGLLCKTAVVLGGILVCCIWGVLGGEDGQEQQKPMPSQYPKYGGPVAHKRFGLEELMDWKDGKKGAGGDHHDQPPPGFGMYPLWKFHKFDGFSLRPVPIQLDIGSGIPAPPPTVMPDYAPPAYPPPAPSYPPTPSYPSPPPPSYPAPPSYPPTSYPATSYPSSPSYPASYSSPYTGTPYSSYGGSSSSSSSYAPPGGYGQQQPTSYTYQQQQHQPEATYQPTHAPQSPITMGYQPVGSYTAPSPPPSYSPPAAPSYQQPPTYSAPTYPSQSNYGGNTYTPTAPSYPQATAYSGAPEMSYSPSNNQPVSTAPGSGFTGGKSPSYVSFEGSSSQFGGVSDLSMPLDSNQGGGYVKRYYNTESESSNKPTTGTTEGISSDKVGKQ